MIRSTAFSILSLALGLLLLSAGADRASADDTEIYRAEYGASAGGRPKVLIVFDDSGSMGDPVRSRLPYDPSENYSIPGPSNDFNRDRIYWTLNDNAVPEDRGDTPYFNSDSDDFTGDPNRCASSYGPLADSGFFTASGAARWREPEEQEDVVPDCSCDDPDDFLQGEDCYEVVPVFNADPKLVRVGDSETRRYCTGFVFFGNCYFGSWVNEQYCPSNPGGSLATGGGSFQDGCYEVRTPTDAQIDAGVFTGWYEVSDNLGTSCPGGGTYVNIDGGGAACYSFSSVVEGETVDEVDYGSSVPAQCAAIPVIPGEWLPLDEDVNSPTHVECRDDVEAALLSNGSDQSDGYPQNLTGLAEDEYGPTVDNSIEWRGTYRWYTGNYLNYWNDPDQIVDGDDKIVVAQQVIGNIISTNPGIDFGLLEFNGNWSGTNDHGGRVVQRIIENMTDAQRNDLINNKLNVMTASGSTPLCEATYEAYRYMAGQTVYYGDNDDGWRSGDLLSRDTGAESPLGTYESPSSDCAYTYVIVMTDGLPQNDTDANSTIESLTGKTCQQYDGDGNTSKNCLPELAEYMANTDLDGDTTNGDQFAITYTIGFTTEQQLLSDAAEKGKGEYYTAFDADQLTEAFQGAITSILAQDTTFTSPAVAVDTFTRTQSRNEVYYAMFKPGNTVDWIGNIKKLRLDFSTDEAILVDANGNAAINPADGNIKATARTIWSTTTDGGAVDAGGAGALLAARNPSTRTLYINTGSGGALQLFNDTNITAASMGVGSDSALYGLFGATSESGFLRQLNWSRGYDAYDNDGDGSTNDNRKWILGDILHSQPLVINYGARSGFTEDDPDMRILVGTNNGFVHFFGSEDGIEDWAFFPKEIASVLPERRRNAVDGDNIYGMDLTPVTYTEDADSDGTLNVADGDKVWAFLGMRRGGRSYYALNLSNPDSPQFMWRIGSDVAGFAEMGQTWSEPVVTRVPGYTDGDGKPKPVLVFGAGYDTNKDATGIGTSDARGRGVFIVDAETGALVWSVTPRVNSATNLQEAGLTHSVPGSVTAMDSNGDDLTDRIYFGDTGGNLWRVDLPGNARPTSSQDTWRIVKLADFNIGLASADRRFFNAPDVVRIRFGGAPIDAVIIGSGDRTNPNATDVENKVYMIRDRAVAPYTTAVPTASECAEPDFFDFRCQLPLGDGDMYDVTDGDLQSDVSSVASAARQALEAANGWSLTLQNPGEKSLSKSLTIDGQVYITTFTPSNLVNDINACEPQSGSGQLYIRDLYDASGTEINLGGIIPDTPSVHFGEDGKLRLLLPPGAPPGDDEDDDDDGNCKNGVCDIGVDLDPPYGYYWYQEEY